MGLSRNRRNVLARGCCLLAALFTIGLAMAKIATGNLLYSNYWGGLVFAPLVLVGGLVFLAAVLFRWRKLQQRPGDKKGRLPDAFRDDWRKW